MSTPTVALHEIAEVRLGRQRSPKDHGGDQMRPYVRAANIGWSGWKLDDVKSMNFTDAEMRTYRLKPGDLLLGEASGSAHEVGKPALWEGQIEDCAFQNTLIRVRPRSADSKYLLHYFAYCAASGQFAQRSRGVGIFHLGRKALAEMPVPFPPIEEQRRIAAVLDAADTLRAKRHQALAKFDTLTQAIFIDMFGDPSRGSRWPLASLGELCRTKGEYGANVPSEPPTDSKPRYLRITDIRPDGSLADARVAPGGAEVDWRSKSLAVGDIVFARSGATVGKTFLMRPENEPMVFAGYLIRFVPDATVVLPEFLYQYTTTQMYENWVENSATTVAQPNLNAKRYAGLTLPSPPLTEQRRFVDRVDLVREKRRDLVLSRDRLDVLLASLQQQAFRGEL